MFKRKIKMLLFAASAMVITVSSCKKNDDELPKVEENELITTVKLKFTNKANASDVKLFNWKDLDGQGGNNPQIDEILLAPNTAYRMEIDAILNEAQSPAVNIKEEVAKEADDHLFVFKPVAASIMTVTITDKDSKNLPVGLLSDAVTTTAGTGTLQVILRHQPNIKNGTEALGSTDLDATFTVKVL
ncbi:MAG TPA: hypothetical protein VGB63_12790 [Pedobacter sp.]|jgi:hypothetical protein